MRAGRGRRRNPLALDLAETLKSLFAERLLRWTAAVQGCPASKPDHDPSITILRRHLDFNYDNTRIYRIGSPHLVDVKTLVLDSATPISAL